MKPIWDYTKRMRTNNKNKHQPIKKENGTLTNNTQEELQRWEEWIRECFYNTPEQLIPTITHIKEETWNKIETNNTNTQTNDEIHPDLKTIRNASRLQQLINKEPYAKTWLNMEYSEKI